MHNSKKDLRRALEENDLHAVVVLSKVNRKVVSQLVRISYDKETLAGWRAIKTMGLIARELVGTDIMFLRETCRKLLWSLSDESGGIGWSAPELLGEIVSADPRLFADLIPLIASVYDVEEDTFRPGVLYALLKIAQEEPETAVPHAEILIQGLEERDPCARFFALEGILLIADHLDQSHISRIKRALQPLLSDTEEALVYEGDNFIRREVKTEAEKLHVRFAAFQ